MEQNIGEALDTAEEENEAMAVWTGSRHNANAATPVTTTTVTTTTQLSNTPNIASTGAPQSEIPTGTPLDASATTTTTQADMSLSSSSSYSTTSSSTSILEAEEQMEEAEVEGLVVLCPSLDALFP